MEKARERTLSFRRVEWPVPSTASLCQLLAAALASREKPLDTQLSRPDGSNWQVRNRSGDGDELLLHVVAYVPGEQASTVPLADDATDLGRASPPEDQEFLEGDAMMLVRGDDVVLCVSAVQERSLTDYIRLLLSQSGFDAQSKQFSLSKHANRDVIGQLLKEGVRKVRLNVTAPEVSAILPFGGSWGRLAALTEKALDLVRGLVGSDRSDQELERLSGLRSYVEIRADNEHLDQGAKIAENVLDNIEGDYEIVTMRGIRITPSEIALKEKVSFTADGKTVVYSEVWARMKEFYDRLKLAGLS
jgi:hypothetical protein